MGKIVAVEEGLTPVRDFLQAKGCQVVGMAEAEKKQVDAIVISGLDQNVTGMEDIVSKTPIIVNAKGRTPAEIWNDISGINVH